MAINWVQGDIVGRMHSSGHYYDVLYKCTPHGYWTTPDGQFVDWYDVELRLENSDEFEILIKDGQWVGSQA